MTESAVSLGNTLFAIAWLLGGIWWASKVHGCVYQIITFIFGGLLIGVAVEVIFIFIIALLQ